MVWPARSSGSQSLMSMRGFSRKTLGSSYLTTSNDSGSFDWRCKQDRWAAMPQQLIDTLFSAWADAVKPA
ncbi:hypothetical protein TNCV_4763931 [Trichonephila clavipes]|nr:hypothetical protein TNCV_4763931 [Trichonephila clavipes]